MSLYSHKGLNKKSCLLREKTQISLGWIYYMMSRHSVIPPSRGAFVFPLMAEKRRFLLSSGSIAPRRHTCMSAGRWPTSNLHNLSEGSGIFWGCQGLQQGSRPAEVQAVSTPTIIFFFSSWKDWNTPEICSLKESVGLFLYIQYMWKWLSPFSLFCSTCVCEPVCTCSPCGSLSSHGEV